MSVTLTNNQAFEVINDAFANQGQVSETIEGIYNTLLKAYFYQPDFDPNLKFPFLQFVRNYGLIEELIERACEQTEAVNVTYADYAYIAEIIVKDTANDDLLYNFVQAFETDSEELAFIEIQAELIKEYDINLEIEDSLVIAPDVLKKIVLCNLALCQINNDNE